MTIRFRLSSATSSRSRGDDVIANCLGDMTGELEAL
jgi:hypothetical protein